MRWTTREDVKVDRVACPWVIQRFVDPPRNGRPRVASDRPQRSRPGDRQRAVAAGYQLHVCVEAGRSSGQRDAHSVIDSESPVMTADS